MKRDELLLLRDLGKKEQERRKKIIELLDNNFVQEYLKLSNTDPIDIDPNNMREILESVLKIVKITKSNGIYVCTNAYDIRSSICYEETSYYHSEYDIDRDDVEYKIYGDIETGDFIKAKNKNSDNEWIKNIISDFERNNIVLNPTNSHNNMNNYQEVKLDFFENAINYGQSKSKQLLLKKYNRL